MKTIKIGTLFTVLLVLAGGFAVSLDIETVKSYQLFDKLLSLSGPEAPLILDDMVIFTAPSSHRRVGIAFADEDFSSVHWFRQLLVRTDAQDSSAKNPYQDSGILFYVHQIPEGAVTIEYRMIINGLWTTDPANPGSRRDSSSGLTLSTLAVPPAETINNPLKGPPGSLNFVFKGQPGETVTVAGSFNGWDPFMYELKEGPAGNYSINIPLPPGKYQYVFFCKGQRYLDPYNSNRVYAKDGNAACEIVIE